MDGRTILLSVVAFVVLTAGAAETAATLGDQERFTAEFVADIPPTPSEVVSLSAHPDRPPSFAAAEHLREDALAADTESTSQSTTTVANETNDESTTPTESVTNATDSDAPTNETETATVTETNSTAADEEETNSTETNTTLAGEETTTMMETTTPTDEEAVETESAADDGTSTETTTDDDASSTVDGEADASTTPSDGESTVTEGETSTPIATFLVTSVGQWIGSGR